VPGGKGAGRGILKHLVPQPPEKADENRHAPSSGDAAADKNLDKVLIARSECLYRDDGRATRRHWTAKTRRIRAGLRSAHASHATRAIPNRRRTVIVQPRARYSRNMTRNDEMPDFVDGTAFNHEQGARARKLFAAVVLAALDDAIADDKKYGNGPEQIARWARSRDGREVLTCAGIDPNERVVKGLMDFVAKGVRTSVALSREESERRHALEMDQAEAA
jgi:hypothetical protein